MFDFAISGSVTCRPGRPRHARGTSAGHTGLKMPGHQVEVAIDTRSPARAHLLQALGGCEFAAIVKTLLDAVGLRAGSATLLEPQ